jgi:adenosyl cobinamide kinase/adenosyl cobinamide phosphate guanylyltransferase
LGGILGKIDYFEAAVAKCHPSGHVATNTVWPSMNEAVQHHVERLRLNWLAITMPNSRNSTHAAIIWHVEDQRL